MAASISKIYILGRSVAVLVLVLRPLFDGLGLVSASTTFVLGPVFVSDIEDSCCFYWM